jgi:hypothetical protein
MAPEVPLVARRGGCGDAELFDGSRQKRTARILSAISAFDIDVARS